MGTVNEVKSDRAKDLARLKSLNYQIKYKTRMIDALYMELEDIYNELPDLDRVDRNDKVIQKPLDELEDAVGRLQGLAVDARSFWEKHTRS